MGVSGDEELDETGNHKNYGGGFRYFIVGGNGGELLKAGRIP